MAVGLHRLGSLTNADGLLRSLYFWYGIFPVYLHYRGIQLLKRDLGVITSDLGEQWYSAAHERHALRLRDLHYALRGYYLKNAQLLSTQPDMVPAAWMAWMEKTQDSVPSEFESYAAARAYCAEVLEREQGLAFDEVFSEWQDAPLGVASIGQVHRARLRRTGEAVAVKLQFAGMERRFRSDLRTLKAFCHFAMPQHVTGFKEVENSFDSEFNYTLEALNLLEVRAAVMPRWGSRVAIPRPFLEYTSKSLLVMEFFEGRALMAAVRSHAAAVASLVGRDARELEEETRRAMRDGSFRYRTLDEERKVGRRLWLALRLKQAVSRLNPLRLLRGKEIQTESPAVTPVLLDVAHILEVLCSVHASELFAFGVFNADCHPGNVLLLEDGRIGLLDYGQVKRIEREHRVRYARLIVALAADDREAVVRLHFEELGVRTLRMSSSVAYLAAAFYHDRDSHDVTGGRDMVTFLEHIESLDPMVQLPEPYLLAMRGNMILRGVAKVMGVRLRMSHMWLAEAKQLLESEGVQGYY